jgi:RHS repeat-associated protein
MFYMPAGIGYDSSGQALYVADQANNRIRKIQFQIGSQGPQNVVVTTVAGTGQMGQGCQPGPTYTFPAPASQPAVSATVTSPTSVAADHQGNIYIADTENDCVRQLSGSNLIRYAGTGQGASLGDGGDPKQAALVNPLYMAFYQGSNLLVSTGGTVRLVMGGVIQTVAGGGMANPDSGQQAPTDVQLAATGIAVDPTSGNLYINSHNEILVVTGGTIQKFAGGGNDFFGQNIPATSMGLSDVTALAVDTQGNLLIADACDIRRVTPGGIADTIAGMVQDCGYSGDSSPLAPGPATQAQLYSPSGLAVDPSGNIYLADTHNNRIRVLVPTSSTSGAPAQPGKLLGDCSSKYSDSQIPCSPSAGDPINIATGNVFYGVTDYETAGPNKLAFHRYYNSRGSSTTFAQTLGVNWRSTYDRYIDIASTSSVSVERADGQTLNFTLADATWTPDTDVDLKLTQSGSSWTLVDRQDNVETYTGVSPSEAVLSSVRARNGYTQTLNRDASNKLLSVSDSYGRTLSLTYNAGLLQTVTTPDGLILSYSYASSGLTPGVDDQLVAVAYSTSPATSQTYVYENPAVPLALTGVIDEDSNRFSTWEYDSSSRGLSAQLGAGLITVSYNDSDGSRVVTNPLGQQELYLFATLQGVPKVKEIDRLQTASTAAASRQFTYDGNGYLASQTDWNGNLTDYVNDVHGQAVSVTEDFGGPQQRTLSTTYHSTYHLPLKIVEPGLTLNFTYDSAGNLLSRTATDTTTSTVPYSTNGQSRTTTYTWANSLLASFQNVRTDITELTQLTYDASGALTSITNALGQTMKITAHLPGGLPQTVVDANGVSAAFAYDARMRLLSTVLTTGAGPLTTSFTYDPAGNVMSVTLPDNSSLTNNYDAAHRLTSVTDLFGQRILYVLDSLGDVTQATVSGATGAVQFRHTYGFDSLGRLMTDIGGAGQTTRYTYDANGSLLTLADPLSRVTQQSFDALNRVVQVTDAAGGATAFAYDPLNRPTTATDANRAVTTYTYDGFGEVIQKVSPDTGTTVYTYDPDGNLIQSVDASGAIGKYSYDALQRITTATYPGDPSENIAYRYDQHGSGFGVGRLTSLTDSAGTLNRTYDERGNVLNESRTMGNTTLSTNYTYDAANRIASVTYPSGWLANYARDAMGRVAGITAKSPAAANAQPILSRVGYQAFGPMSSAVWGNNVSENRSFDLDSNLTVIADSGTATLQQLAYGYDAAANVLSIADGVTPGNNQEFQYDALYHLVSASGGYGTLGYTYDGVGNRLTQTVGSTVTNYSYTAQSNQLVSVTIGGTAQKIGYTKTGDIASFLPAQGMITTLTYNQAGMLIGAMAGNQQASQYTYDAFGQRLVEAGGSTVLYQYDGSGRLLEESDGEGNPLVDYVYLDSLLIATVAPATGQIYYVHSDHLGAPQLATDVNQAIAWSASYQPFGALASVPALIVQDLRLPGQEYDPSTGWYHNGFRDYVPLLGRYLQSDPAGLAGGMNTYAYADANPVNHIDPLGLDDGCPKIDYFSASNTNFKPTSNGQVANEVVPDPFFDSLPALLFAPIVAGAAEAGTLLLGSVAKEAPAIEAAVETAIGKVPQVVTNKLVGSAAERSFVQSAEANGMQVVGTQVGFRTPFGTRMVDAVLRNPTTGQIGGVELKSSLGAFNRFNPGQFAKDAWINSYGATSVDGTLQIQNTIKLLWRAP